MNTGQIFLIFAQPGDQLIIDPEGKEDWRAKRILKLISWPFNQ